MNNVKWIEDFIFKYGILDNENVVSEADCEEVSQDIERFDKQLKPTKKLMQNIKNLSQICKEIHYRQQIQMKP